MPFFRADHIGSLLRPKKLREAFRAKSGIALKEIQDEAIRDVVRLQRDCGLQVVTDGEFRRISYWEKFVRLTNGLEVKDAVFTFHDAEGHESKFTAPYVSGKVSRGQPITRARLRQYQDHHASALDHAFLSAHRLGQRL
jgi:5-methyltetrahydropteroyltriglutamate--homocysteine methyltransferase